MANGAGDSGDYPSTFRYKVRLGEFDFSRDYETQAIEFDVANVKTHEGFVFIQGEELTNDLALLTLDGELQKDRTQE